MRLLSCGPADGDLVAFLVSGSAGEETSDARPAESGAGGPGDAVSVWATGSPHQGTDAAGWVT